MPKASVIITTCNRADMLREAIRSVLNQTFQDFEIIVVDDASEHDATQVTATFNDKRIKVICHDANRGEAAARNTGLTAAASEYIAFLDDDDEWLPEKLGRQVSILEHGPPDTGLVYTGVMFIDSANNRTGQKVPSHRGNIYRELMERNLIATPSAVLLKKECAEAVGLFDGNIAYGLDYDYWIRLSKFYLFECIPEPLTKYRIHKNRLSNDIELRARGARDLADKYGPRIISNDYWQSVFFSLGMRYCNNGEMLKGIMALSRYIRHNPSNIRPYFYVAMALLGPRCFRKLMGLRALIREKAPTSADNRRMEKIS